MNKFGWSPGNLYAEVSRKYGQGALQPGGFVTSPVEGVSLGLALMFGLLGLLMGGLGAAITCYLAYLRLFGYQSIAKIGRAHV